ncbi:hypothetical protein [Martelella sp. UBA3392]|uniref:hypothetical protein n=2 Tax=unclassified Martelella TaxID=2629616 RepID=UPI0031F5B539
MQPFKEPAPLVSRYMTGLRGAAFERTAKPVYRRNLVRRSRKTHGSIDMFEQKTSASDIMDRLRFSQKTPVERASAMVRDEVDALARTARKHPAGSGSALAFVGLLAFGLGFLTAHAGQDDSVPKKRLFRSRQRVGKPVYRKRTPYYAMKSKRRAST